MALIARSPAAAAAATARPSRRVFLIAAIATAAVIGFVPWDGLGSAADGDLTLLLRFMAAIKGMMALGAAALAWWRLGWPASAGIAFGYAGAAMAMAAGTGLIWNIAHVIAGAALFHAGLFGLIALAILDDGSRSAVRQAIDRRRAALARR